MSHKIPLYFQNAVTVCLASRQRFENTEGFSLTNRVALQGMSTKTPSSIYNAVGFA
jgi:hypothetical protein